MIERLTRRVGLRERFILRRLLMIPISLIVLVTLSFGLISLMPGDPAAVIAGSFASEEEIADIRTQLGLDDPLVDRYVDYLTWERRPWFPGTMPNQVLSDRASESGVVRFGHPTGVESVGATVELQDGEWKTVRVGYIRTARRIMEGYAYVRKDRLAEESRVVKPCS